MTRNHRLLLSGAACVAGPLMVFSGVLANGFVNWDDPDLILNNPLIRGFGWAGIWGMFSSLYMTTYQPLTWLVYAALLRLWGPAPGPFHAASWFFHAANAALLFAVTMRLLDAAQPGFSSRRFGPAAAAAATLLWALHPLFAQSVAWATNLSDLMASFFALSSLFAYLRASGLAVPWLLLGASFLCRWKAMGLPIVMLALDAYPLRRFQNGRARVLAEKALFLLPAFAAAWLGARAKAQAGYAHVGARPHEACAALLFYLQKTLAPFGLVPLYVFEGSENPLGLSLFPAVAAIGAITGGLVILRRAWPAGLVLWTLWVVALLPPFLFSQDGPVFATNYYAYLAVMGGVPPLAWLLERGLGSPRTRAVTTGAAAAVLLFLSVLSVRNVRAWRDSISLWTHTLEVDPKAYVARMNLADAYYREGRVEEAAEQLRRHLRIHPDDLWARRSLEGVLARSPGLGYHAAQALNNEAVDLCERDRCAEALPLFERSLSLEDSPEVRRNLDRALAKLGRRR